MAFRVKPVHDREQLVSQPGTVQASFDHRVCTQQK